MGGHRIRRPGRRHISLSGRLGFDPEPYLEQLDVPGLWLYGGNDTSVPVARSISNLENIRERLDRDWTFVVYPSANHSLIRDGAMCQVEGPVVDLSVTLDWLAPRLVRL